jgi:membrane protein YqaA with SNARE-associated domain
MAYRLGWVLYWACLALIPAWVLIVPQFVPLSANLASALFLFMPVLILYGLGRALRYVLSGE